MRLHCPITFPNMLQLTLFFVLASVGFGRNANHNFPIGEKIVGGHGTTIKEHPYQTSIELHGKHVCGGSLIKPNVVLTAAHCIEFNLPSYYTVRAGSSITGAAGQLASVVSICTHPKYIPFDYDVSVLKLSTSFVLGPLVQLMQLQPSGVSVPDDTIATVTGWGALAQEGPAPTVLQKLDIPKINDEECRRCYPMDNVTPRMTCYGYLQGGQSACHGDSGGPLVANGKQVGIVSWGRGCALPNLPSFYTRIEDEDIQAHIFKCLSSFLYV